MTNHSEASNKLQFDQKLTNLFKLKGFTVETMLSRGAYGRVYRGTNLKTDKPVAIKVMFIQEMKPKVLDTFVPREIEILKQMSQYSHPHIVYVLDILYARKTIFIVMECATDGDLTRYSRRNGPIAESHTAIWFAQLASALHFLHVENRIAHRDIKAENCLLFGNLVKLTDFGFATEAWDWQRQQPLLCRTWCGTAPYFCPQILKYTAYNAFAADCYSMGVLLFAMLNDKFPFHHQSSKLHFREQTDPGFLRTRYIKQFSANLLDLQTGLLTVEEPIRMDIQQVMAHPWIKGAGK